MDSFEFTKIATAVLAALLLIVGGRTLIHEMQQAQDHAVPQTTGYKLPDPPKETAGKAGKDDATPVPAAFDAAAIPPLLKSASVENGQAAFTKCALCHKADKDGATVVGPNLWGIVGRDIASVEGYPYSPALKAKEGGWTYEELAKFLHNPAAYAPGTLMGFVGISEQAELADLLAYMQSRADTPVPFP